MGWLGTGGRKDRMADEPKALRPVLDLSGPVLRESLASLVRAAEPLGGVERLVALVALKAKAFSERLGEGRIETIGLEDFADLCALMPTVRRRLPVWLDGHDFATLRALLAALLGNWRQTGGTDSRLAAFCAAFPQDRAHRWVRDLAAEVLHYTYPTHYPLMTRWVWDRASNTGVLREIWFGEDVDRTTLEAQDDYATLLILREELSQFLSDNGVYRDMPFYVDLLAAHIYGGYVAAQGGSYLRADFAAPEDPLLHTRRMLGLDEGAWRLRRAARGIVEGEAAPPDPVRLP